MSLTPVSHHECQWSLSSACFVAAHISEWQHSHQKRDDGRPSDSSTGAATKRASHAPLTLTMWNSLNRAESLSFRNKIAWVFESRSQVQFVTINGAALKNILRGYRHVLARPVGSRETHQISRDLVPWDLVTSLLFCLIQRTACVCNKLWAF